MKPKLFWAWTVAVGILLVIIGGLLAVIPYVGLPVMGLGILMMAVGIIAMIPILIREMRKDDQEIRDNIKKEDLRP